MLRGTLGLMGIVEANAVSSNTHRWRPWSFDCPIHSTSIEMDVSITNSNFYGSTIVFWTNGKNNRNYYIQCSFTGDVRLIACARPGFVRELVQATTWARWMSCVKEKTPTNRKETPLADKQVQVPFQGVATARWKAKYLEVRRDSNEREGEREKRTGGRVVVRDTTFSWVGGEFPGSEGSQAVPAHLSW
jgi:hypothetical protein